MATLESVKNLYIANVSLAYTEMQMHKVPTDPFSFNDKPKLKSQANSLANFAADLRSIDEVSDLDQSLVDNTKNLISKAQTLFDMVNNQINSSIDANEIFESVENVLASLKELFM